MSENIFLQTAYITFVTQQIKEPVTIDDLKDGNLLAHADLLTQKKLNEVVNFISWQTADVVKSYQKLLSDYEIQKMDREIIKKRKIATCPFLFSNCLIENSIILYLDNRESIKSQEVMRDSSTFSELVENNFSKIYNKIVTINKNEIRNIFNSHFLIKSIDQEKYYERACNQNKILKGINNFFTHNQYLEILRQFKALKDYALGGTVAQHIHATTKIALTDINKTFIPPLKKLYECSQGHKGLDQEDLDQEDLE